MVSTVIGVILLIIAAILLVVGGMGWAGKLPGNSVIGIKVEEVRKSQEIWDAAHKVAGPLWFFAGAVFAFAGLFAFRASGWFWLIVVALAIIALVAIGVGGSSGARIAANRDVAQMVKEQNPEPAPSAKVDMDALRKAVDRSDDAN